MAKKENTKKTKVVKNAKPIPKKKGRPASYTDALADELCHKIATNVKSLKSICSADDMPSVRVVMRWLSNDINGFRQKYARAKEDQADLMAEEMIEIADDSSNDTMIGTSKSGEPIEMENKEWVNRSKLRVDTRKWLASKLKPKKYGDKVQTEHSGEVTVTQITGMKIE